MSEAIRGDVLTKAEMKMRGIRLMPSERGGIELRTHDSANTIAIVLIQKGFIEDFHHRDASVFLDLRRAYNASQGIKWGHVDTSSSNGLSPGESSERYDAIRHQMGIKRAATVARDIERAMLEEWMVLHEAEMNIYRRCFEDLSRAMMEVKTIYA